MFGFLIKSGGRYLDRKKQWRRKPAEEAYVFSHEAADAILAEAKAAAWPRMPEFLVSARYHEVGDRTEVVSSIPAYPANP
jgi:hypothetical protein